MAKRNPYFEQEKRYRRMVHEMVPQIYAAFALVLHRQHGFGYTRIMRVLYETQELWQAHARKELDIVKVCEEETGLNMVSETTAKERGMKGDAKI